MSLEAQTLFSLLPAVYRTRDAEIAESLRGALGAAEASELLALEALPDPTDAENVRLGELRERASRCTLTPAEVIELAALAALPAATPAEQERASELRSKGSRGPLKALLTALAGEIAVLEENLEQLYDDLFIETCADWVVPYIADLLGSEPLHTLGARPGLARAETGHIIGLRKRKGSAAVLEQLARDLTGWNARAVEFFQLLATTQYMNHVRHHNVVSPSMRNGGALDWVGTAFDPFPRRFDVRRIASGRGKYNIPNVGIFLWRVDAHRLRESPARPEGADGRRFRFSPLGNDIPLYTRPVAEDHITHLAEPLNVPVPISRRLLHRDLSAHQDDGNARYYGPGKSLVVHAGASAVPVTQVVACNLSDANGTWAHDAPDGKIAIDPELGRLVVAADLTISEPLRVTYHYGAIGNLGGGEYASVRTEDPEGALLRVPDDHPTIQHALDALGGAGVVEITDDGIYAETLSIAAGVNRSIELRAAPGRRPTLNVTGPLVVVGGAGSSVVLSGLLIAGEAVTVGQTGNDLRRLRLIDTTLVPGIELSSEGRPLHRGTPSLVVASSDVEVLIERCIVGAVRTDPGSRTAVRDSVIDAGAPEEVAYAAPDGADPAPGGELSFEACTVIGGVRCRLLEASNSILLGRAEVVRRQEGCVRFSYLPLNSLAPRRFLCQPRPGEGEDNYPHFTSLRYGVPAYCQLSPRTPPAIRTGADDESEMGVFHRIYQPQLESNMTSRLEEFLRVGLQAGIFYES